MASSPFRLRVLQLLTMCLVATAGLAPNPSVAADFELTVVTFNVLVEIGSGEGIPPWRKRRDASVKMLQEQHADLIGLQEPTPRQVDFFRSGLPEYDTVSHGRFSDVVLLYKRDTFELVDQGLWWLSPTPEKEYSKGFGNFLPRILIWARLKHLPSGRELIVANTHFDNTRPSQTKMAALCQEQFKPLMALNLPMIWMGDFNTDQERGDYPALTSEGWRDSYLANSKASKDGRDDNVPTFPGENGRRIDHIFIRGPIQSVDWHTIVWTGDETPLSDHYPVVAKLIVKDE